MSDKIKLINQLVALLGGKNNNDLNQISFFQLEKNLEYLEPNERVANRSIAIKDLTKLIKDCGSDIHYMVICEIIKYCEKLPTKDFTIPTIVIGQLDQFIGKELSPDNIDTLSNWGNSLIDFGYGFDDDEQFKKFTDIFGDQSEDFHKSLLARAIGCGVLSLLPSEKQAPGGNSFNLVFSEGLLEACISIFAAQVYYYEKDASGKLPISSVPLDFIQTILTDLRIALHEKTYNNK